jgi:WD40 repeat protein
VSGCAWSPDGTRLVSASRDNTLRIWNAKTGKSALTLLGHTNWVYGCAWSPDGARLVSASADHTLRIWDAQTGESVATLQGHTGSVESCAWSPDGKRIVSASDDGTIRTWHAATGQEIAPTLYHFAQGWASLDHQNNRILACSPDAWRYLGWIVPDANGMPEWLPAETFGELPVVESVVES